MPDIEKGEVTKPIKLQKHMTMKMKTSQFILAALSFALGAAIALPAGAQDKTNDDPRMAGFKGKIGRTFALEDKMGRYSRGLHVATTSWNLA